ncbi:MAG: glycine-rich protein, partial [Candidatus Cybelea sp.]
MSIWSFIRFSFGALAGVAILFGCGQNPNSTGVPIMASATAARSGKMTFNYTGAEQTFKVPSGVKSLTIDASAAAGYAVKPGKGGRGGRVVATVPVTQGETLYVFVGGQGAVSIGGFNGGGAGGSEKSREKGNGGGGGGASDVREGGSNLSNRIVVAGSGGGQGFEKEQGGLGGGLVGGAGKGRKPSGHGSAGGGGDGGTQSQGGAGGIGGNSYGAPGSPG